jgi:hypothetical protein
MFVSADYRIGEMSAITIGAKYGVALNEGKELSFRLEYYHQMPSNSDVVELQGLSGLDITPVVDAIIVQVSYSF